MIISEIEWGLGNQLFQYAAGLSLARHLNVPLLIDKTNYETNKTREFCLNYFEINDLKTELDDEFKDVSFNFYLEPHFHFDENLFKCSSFTYMSGFWQTEKYFINIKNEILEKFQLKKQFTNHLNISKLNFHNCNSVNLHIRRGDYAYYHFLGIQPMGYYYKAIKYLSQNLDNIIFYIFSDDISWVKQNFKITADHIFVSDSYTNNHLEDFFLMQQCKHHIIANSTFSWWAAWLCSYERKIVIAPSIWFADRADANTQDLLPADWLKI